jgi:cytosine permease
MALDTTTTPASPLPAYLRAATPNPISNRAPWYKNTAPTYAGIFLWFVFWDTMAVNGGLDRGGLVMALLGVLLGGLICHFLFYLVPGLLGMKTGLPLYIVGTSTFGSIGGLLMPGFLMGLLQFGWLAVNTFFASGFLADEAVKLWGGNRDVYFYVLCVLWAGGAAFVGLKGIQYVAKVATFLPLIPLAVLILALVKFAPSAGSYQPAAAEGGAPPWMALLAMTGAIVGFFATAGAAGVDFGMNSKDAPDVNRGGVVGILLAILLTAGGATLAVAGARGMGALPNAKIDEPTTEQMQKDNKSEKDIQEELRKQDLTLTNGLKSEKAGLPPWLVSAMMIGLTIAAFPGACFSSFIAANSFKTVMPQVNSFLSVGLGALVSIILAVSRVAGDLGSVFGIIGASFGPICGAMCVDYLLAGRKWPGPRAGFNPAGWVAWLLGFLVGILPNIFNIAKVQIEVPAASVAAFVVGAVVYFVLAKAGLESKVLPYGPAQQPQSS